MKDTFSPIVFLGELPNSFTLPMPIVLAIATVAVPGSYNPSHCSNLSASTEGMRRFVAI
jgi:hypothetical protein